VSPAPPYRAPVAVEEAGPSELDRLGAVCSVHAPPPLPRALAGPVLLAGVVLGAGLAAGGPLWLVAPFAAAALAGLAWSPLRQRGLSVALHAEGLVLAGAGTRREVAFEDVNEVWFEVDTLQSRAGASLQAMRLVEHSGAVHRLPLGVNGAAALTSAVLRACSEPLLADARRALADGETLTFGPVLLDRTGITAGGARLPWPSLRLAVVQRARVSLYRRSPIFAWRTVRLDRVPHPTVFLALVMACVAEVRVHDRILVPFATSDERGAALTAQMAAGGPDLALRAMLVGGSSFLLGVLIVAATCSSRGAFWLPYGPIVIGAVWFVRGLRAYLERPRR